MARSPLKIFGLALALAGCGGGGGGPSDGKRGETVSEPDFGYELRLPAGWKSLGRRGDRNSLEFGGDGRGCTLDGGTPPPSLDDPDALLRQSEDNYERFGDAPQGSRGEFKLLPVPGSAIAVEGRITMPGGKLDLSARIASASAAITIACQTDEDREAGVEEDLLAIYGTVRMRSSTVAERLQPELAVLPTVAAAWVEEEPGQISASLEVTDMRQAVDSVLTAVRRMHEEDAEKRIAVVAENPDDASSAAIQGQLERGAKKIFVHAAGRNRHVPLDE